VLTKVTIAKVVKVNLPKGFIIKSYIRSVIASLVKAFHSLNKGFILLKTGGKFNHQGLLHSLIIEHFTLQVKERRKGEFLCQLKQAVSFA